MVGIESAETRTEKCREAMGCRAAHEAVGGELVTGGGTGTYLINTWTDEIQAGSYALMDTAYGRLGLPFRQALFVLATVISTSTPDSGAGRLPTPA